MNLSVASDGKKITCSKALQIGAVCEFWPLAELKGRVIRLAQELATQPAESIKGMVETIVAIRPSAGKSLFRPNGTILICLESLDSRESMAAFLEKRRSAIKQQCAH